jgi:hypothetical protein
VTGNDEERPFSRDERRWVYASSKRENNYFGFGSERYGDRDAALAAVERATVERDPALTNLAVDPRLEPIRSDSRFT